MPRSSGGKPPVKPIGRILYSERFGTPNDWGQDKVPAKFESVCSCKGFSDDKPFSVYKASDPQDSKPFKVVFHWTNPNPKMHTVKKSWGDHEEHVDDTYYMSDILEEHVSKSAAQKAMRSFAEKAFAKVNDAAQKEGDRVHATWHDVEHDTDHTLRVGDLVDYSGCAGILFRVVGERRVDAGWFTVIAPVLSFLVNNGTDNKTRELRTFDVHNSLKPVDLVKLGIFYTKLGLALQDEVRRKKE